MAYPTNYRYSKEHEWLDVSGNIGTVGITDYAALPLNARKYLERLQALVDVPVDIISTGPDRDQTIVLRHPFDAQT